MGKAEKKKRHRGQRVEPYAPVDMDTSTPDEEMAEDKIEHEKAAEKQTRGAVIQRHKLEWKKLRQEIASLKDRRSLIVRRSYH